ncbi:MAG: hypothetical protein ACI9AU_000946 [Bacteroidia bacterium]|jgi:hypothetical protein
MKIAMVSCKQAAMLGAKASFNALTIFEKMKLKMHVKMCIACQSYKANSELIDEAVAKILEEKQELSLSAEQRKKILDAIQ